MSSTKYIPTILLVEDATENIDFVVAGLNGYRILVAKDGRRALQILEKKVPDLVLLDIEMEGMNGYEVCHEIRKKDSLKEVPVIFMSGNTDETSVREGLDAGGQDYLVKPFERDDLGDMVKKYIR